MSRARMVRLKGAAIVFTLTTQARNASTGRTTPAASTVTGFFRRIQADPQQYEALSLTEAKAVTGEFTPDANDAPVEGMTTRWDGEDFTVRAVNPVKPTDRLVGARVVLER